MSWPGCVPDYSSTQLQVMAAAVWAVQEAALEGPTSPIEAYSCDLPCPGLSAGQSACHLYGRLASSPAGRSNPEFGHYQTMGWNPGVTTVQTDLPELNQFLHKQNHLLL